MHRESSNETDIVVMPGKRRPNAEQNSFGSC